MTEYWQSNNITRSIGLVAHTFVSKNIVLCVNVADKGAFPSINFHPIPAASFSDQDGKVTSCLVCSRTYWQAIAEKCYTENRDTKHGFKDEPLKINNKQQGCYKMQNTLIYLCIWKPTVCTAFSHEHRNYKPEVVSSCLSQKNWLYLRRRNLLNTWGKHQAPSTGALLYCRRAV